MTASEGMTENLERITPWWDRRVMGAFPVATFPVTLIVGFSQPTPEVSVSGILVVVALWLVAVWLVRVHFVTSVSVSATTLVIRNVYARYEIPWQVVSGIDFQPREGAIFLDLANGLRVRVEAFSRWPSFGRHRKVIAILEEGRRQAATDPAADEVRVTETSGITEFLLALAFGATVVALVVRGIIVLVS